MTREGGFLNTYILDKSKNSLYISLAFMIEESLKFYER